MAWQSLKKHSWRWSTRFIVSTTDIFFGESAGAGNLRETSTWLLNSLPSTYMIKNDWPLALFYHIKNFYNYPDEQFELVFRQYRPWLLRTTIFWWLDSLRLNLLYLQDSGHSPQRRRTLNKDPRQEPTRRARNSIIQSNFFETLSPHSIRRFWGKK